MNEVGVFGRNAMICVLERHVKLNFNEEGSRTKERRKRSASSKNTNEIPPQNIVETEGIVVDTNKKAVETEQDQKKKTLV